MVLSNCFASALAGVEPAMGSPSSSTVMVGCSGAGLIACTSSFCLLCLVAMLQTPISRCVVAGMGGVETCAVRTLNHSKAVFALHELGTQWVNLHVSSHMQVALCCIARAHAKW